MDAASVTAVLIVSTAFVFVIGMFLNHRERTLVHKTTVRMAELGLTKTLIGEGEDIRWEWVPFKSGQKT